MFIALAIQGLLYLNVTFVLIIKDFTWSLFAYVLLVAILINAYLIYAFQSVGKRVKMDITYAVLKDEYDAQLKEYTLIKARERDLRYLRHDIINYLNKEQIVEDTAL